MLMIYADAFRIATYTTAPATPDTRPSKGRRSLWARWLRLRPAVVLRPHS